MAGSVPEAVRAAKAGADVIIAQGTEGGGHVGFMASMPLIPMIVDAVAPVPVLAAGGFADGRGLVAALALGAQGILLGTRFLATVELPLHPNFKQAIVDSDGHDTQLSVIPDLASGLVWPGAMTRSRRNRFIERWAGRNGRCASRASRPMRGLQEARKNGDVDEGPLSMGQDAGLVHDIPPAGEIVARIAQEAEQIVTSKLPRCWYRRSAAARKPAPVTTARAQFTGVSAPNNFQICIGSAARLRARCPIDLRTHAAGARRARSTQLKSQQPLQYVV